MATYIRDNIGSTISLLLDSAKPLPEMMLTNICKILCQKPKANLALQMLIKVIITMHLKITYSNVGTTG